MKLDVQLQRIHADLGITPKYLSENKLTYCQQAPLEQLEVVDIDFEGKPFILNVAAVPSWNKMCKAASADGVLIKPFSGFRSYLYQKGLIEKQMAKGRVLGDILTTLAIPGFSEHHTGRAVDLCEANKSVLDDKYELSEAYLWLTENAAHFNFQLSYPRNNKLGIIFEPWHWCYWE